MASTYTSPTSGRTYTIRTTKTSEPKKESDTTKSSSSSGSSSTNKKIEIEQKRLATKKPGTFAYKQSQDRIAKLKGEQPTKRYDTYVSTEEGDKQRTREIASNVLRSEGRSSPRLQRIAREYQKEYGEPLEVSKETPQERADIIRDTQEKQLQEFGRKQSVVKQKNIREDVQSGDFRVVTPTTTQSTAFEMGREPTFTEKMQLQSRYQQSFQPSQGEAQGLTDVFSDPRATKAYVSTQGDVLGVERRTPRQRAILKPDDRVREDRLTSFVREQRLRQQRGLSASPLLLPTEVLSGGQKVLSVAQDVRKEAGRQIDAFATSTIRGTGKQVSYLGQAAGRPFIGPSDVRGLFQESIEGGENTRLRLQEARTVPGIAAQQRRASSRLWADPDVRTAAIGQAFLATGGLGALGGTTGAVARGALIGAETGFAGYGAYQFVRDPSIATGAQALLMGAPLILRGAGVAGRYGPKARDVKRYNFLRQNEVKATGKPFSSKTTETATPFRRSVSITDKGLEFPVETILTKRKPAGFDVPTTLPESPVVGRGRMRTGRYVGREADPFVNIRKERQLQINKIKESRYRIETEKGTTTAITSNPFKIQKAKESGFVVKQIQDYDPYSALTRRQFSREQIGIREPTFFEKARADPAQTTLRTQSPIPERAQRLLRIRDQGPRIDDGIPFYQRARADRAQSTLNIYGDAPRLSITDTTAPVRTTRPSRGGLFGSKRAQASLSFDFGRVTQVAPEVSQRGLIRLTQPKGRAARPITQRGGGLRLQPNLGIYSTGTQAQGSFLGITPAVTQSQRLGQGTRLDIFGGTATNLFTPQDIMPGQIQQPRQIIQTRTDIGTDITPSQATTVSQQNIPPLGTFGFSGGAIAPPTRPQFPRTPPMSLPSFGVQETKGPGSRMPTSRRAESYLPDLPAIFFGQKGKKPKTTTFTGFERRFIIGQ